MRKQRRTRPAYSMFCGIDIGKRRHAVAILDNQEQWLLSPRYINNDREGLQRLVDLLKQATGRRAVIVGLEATGHYWYVLHDYLRAVGYDLAVLNPIQTSARARGQIRKSKTDKMDCRGLARLLKAGNWHAALIPGDLAMSCRQATRLWYTLRFHRSRVKQLIRTKLDCLWPEFEGFLANPLGPTGLAILRAAPTPADLLALEEPALTELIGRASRQRLGTELAGKLRESARQTIGLKRGLEGFRMGLVSLLEQLEASEPVLQRLGEQIQCLGERVPRVLWSLPGAEPIRVVSLFGETDPIQVLRSPEQLVAFAGLDPTVRQSGQYDAPHRRISKRGSPYLRLTLWAMAAAAIQREGELRAYYERRREAGLHHLSAVTATAIKLCRIAWRIMTDGRDYLPELPSRRAENK